PRLAAQVRIDGGLERRENQLVAPHRSKERLTLDCIDHPLAADDDATLRTAEQFVAAETHDIDAALHDFCWRGLMLHARDSLRLNDRAAAEVLDERHPLL